MAKAADTNTRQPSLLAELEAAVAVDKHDLDNAWQEQPDLFYRVAKALAEAIAARDECKLDLNEMIADLDATLRADAGDKKITETSISREIDMAPKIIDKRREYGRLSAKVDQWAALKDGYVQRGYTLKGLTDLHGQAYYQNNSGGSDRRDRMDTRAADIRDQGGEERRNRPQREKSSR